ncbi:hypothetical protein CBS101457_004204 [Exobasidium rhododendri]|nr:hypothetical protein CBS101457_004204 [Exobasidium rhododendri]
MSSANFAPYQPPPDERSAVPVTAPSTSRTPISVPSVPHTSSIPETDGRVSLESDLDPRYATESYQSSVPNSSLPNQSSSYKQSFQSAPAWAQHPHSQASFRPTPQQGRPDHQSYSTAQGWNLSNLCFAAWALPPFSSVLLLIVETENDLVRFHAYQSGLLGVATVLLLWILRSWFGWYTLSIIIGMGSLGYFWICGSSAANSAPTLARSPFLAYVGPLAEQWVGEE